MPELPQRISHHAPVPLPVFLLRSGPPGRLCIHRENSGESVSLNSDQSGLWIFSDCENIFSFRTFFLISGHHLSILHPTKRQDTPSSSGSNGHTRQRPLILDLGLHSGDTRELQKQFPESSSRYKSASVRLPILKGSGKGGEKSIDFRSHPVARRIVKNCPTWPDRHGLPPSRSREEELSRPAGNCLLSVLLSPERSVDQGFPSAPAEFLRSHSRRKDSRSSFVAMFMA